MKGLRVPGCGDRRWLILTQDYVHWQALVIIVFKLWVLLRQC
jgi:hypothetical protein